MDKEESFWVYGSHAVLEALETSPLKIEKLLVKDRYSGESIDKIKFLTSKHKIPLQFVPVTKIDQLVGDVVHQGIIALMRSFEYQDLDKILKDAPNNSLFILMDEIEDPHNVGAIIRSAVAVGARAVIVPKHRNAPINGTVYKTSAGLVDKIDICRVSNIGLAIEKLKKSHIWVGGLAGESEKTIWDQDMTGGFAIVVGNEGAGLHEKVRENCDFLLKIPMNREAESLNASVSAALAMFEWKRQNRG